MLLFSIILYILVVLYFTSKVWFCDKFVMVLELGCVGCIVFWPSFRCALLNECIVPPFTCGIVFANQLVWLSGCDGEAIEALHVI